MKVLPYLMLCPIYLWHLLPLTFIAPSSWPSPRQDRDVQLHHHRRVLLGHRSPQYFFQDLSWPCCSVLIHAELRMLAHCRTKISQICQVWPPQHKPTYTYPVSKSWLRPMRPCQQNEISLSGSGEENKWAGWDWEAAGSKKGQQKQQLAAEEGRLLSACTHTNSG